MRYVIRNNALRNTVLSAIQNLDMSKKWTVEISEYRSPRSIQQNAFLHAVPLRIISDATGNSIEDMKEYLLGEAFGWVDSEVMGRTVSRPVFRSSELNTKQFSWFLEWIEQWASQTLGLIMPRPNEEIDYE